MLLAMVKEIAEQETLVAEMMIRPLPLAASKFGGRREAAGNRWIAADRVRLAAP